jgi:two-component system probable response regulator PhcQ
MSRLMIVDDEPNVTHALRRVLKRHLPPDVRVEAFNDPFVALARARECTFDVVISDYRMPGMDGLLFLQHVQATQSLAVRMILSASSEADAVIKAINDVQAFRYLTKPWSEEELMAQVHLALAHAAAQQDERALADDMRLQRGQLTPQARELKRLEALEPGLTQVDWGPHGEVLMPPLD